jgi:hypothetical protein
VVSPVGVHTLLRASSSFPPHPLHQIDKRSLDSHGVREDSVALERRRVKRSQNQSLLTVQDASFCFHPRKVLLMALTGDKLKKCARQQHTTMSGVGRHPTHSPTTALLSSPGLRAEAYLAQSTRVIQ